MNEVSQVVMDCPLALLLGGRCSGVNKVGQVFISVIANSPAKAAHIVEGQADVAHELGERGEVQLGVVILEQGLPLELEFCLSWWPLLLLLLLIARFR